MKKEQLLPFLEHKEREADWKEVVDQHQPEHAIINGEMVYRFDLTLDRNYSPIESNIAVSQQFPDDLIPLHMHQFIEMTFVYRGACTAVIEGKEVNLFEGEFVLIDKETPHTIKPTVQGDIIINLTLKKDYLSGTFLSRLSNQSIISRFLIDSIINQRNHQHYLLFQATEKDTINDIMEHIMCEFFDPRLCSSEIIDSYLIVLFSELIRSANSQTDHISLHSREGNVTLIDFLHYIEEHYNDCTLTSMASHFGFHPNYLTSLLKKGTSKSFKDLLQLQRLNRAALYLSNSDMPIPDIVEEVGYSSVTFFYKKFKEIFGETPSSYRRKHLGP